MNNNNLIPNFKDLSPSAAKMLLVFFVIQTSGKQFEIEDVFKFVGIRKYDTYLKAKVQLFELGFLFKKGDRTMVTLVPLGQEQS